LLGYSDLGLSDAYEYRKLIILRNDAQKEVRYVLEFGLDERQREPSDPFGNEPCFPVRVLNLAIVDKIPEDYTVRFFPESKQ